MSEIIYQSNYSGSQIDAAIAKVPIIEANMEQKADKTDALIFESVFNGSGDLNTANKINKWYKIDTSAGVLNTPPTTLIPSASWAALYVQGNGLGSFVQTLYSGGYNKVLKRSYFNGVYTAWELNSTTKKSDILLLNGWEVDENSVARVYKNGSNVSMNFNIIGGISHMIFNLPLGFRPNNYIRILSDVQINNESKKESIQISPNGDVIYTSPHDYSQRHYINIQFNTEG